MQYQVLNDSGQPLDAHVDVEGSEFVFHSRGGKRGHPGARNMDYGPALRILLQRIVRAELQIGGAWVDSDEVLSRPRDERSILDGEDLTRSPLDQFRIMSTRMQLYGRSRDAPRGGGSRVKKIRIRVIGDNLVGGLSHVLGLREVSISSARQTELRAAALGSITAEHVWEAVQLITAGNHNYVPHDQEPFDLVASDEERLSPTAVFGMAAHLALGKENFFKHIEHNPDQAYRVLKKAGFELVRRGTSSPKVPVPTSNEDREWVEGRPKLVIHLKRERAPGLSRAKKLSFIRQHGRLRCERCGLDPIEVFGATAGEACIEVHHSRNEIGQMGDGGHTKLTDLECLCANCHRVLHAVLRQQVAASSSDPE